MMRLVTLLVALLVIAPVTAAAQQTQLLLISGVTGEPRFAEAFTRHATSLQQAAKARFAIPDSMVTYLAEDTTRKGARINGRSSKENIERILLAMLQRAKANDRVIIVLFGHGSEQGQAKISLPGPDMTDADFARILGTRGDDATIVFVNTASSSGEFAKTLAGKNRIIVTATKSGREANETLFPAHFVKAIADGAGDSDKDGRVSVLEAFTYARKEVEKIFENGNRIATEHPQLEDDGDGVARGDASDKGPDGIRSRTIFFEPLGGAQLASDPRAAQLIADRRVLEARIDSLRSRRSGMSEEAYQKALEPLMIELAEKTRALRALEARKP
jgi:hypothetical protein